MAWSSPRRTCAAFVVATLPSVLVASPAFAQATPPTTPAPAPATPDAGSASTPSTGGSAQVKFSTSDGKGTIYVDGKASGEGSWIGDLPAGKHTIKMTRAGYDTFEEEITVEDKKPIGRTITMSISSKVSTGVADDVDRLEGLYGGFNLAAIFTPGGTHNDVQKLLCGDSKPGDVTSCDAGSGAGGGLGGFIGYHWDPVGIEFYAAGQYESRDMKVDWKASSTDPGIGPDPARHEDYTLRRAGIMGLFRARLTLQPAKKIRVDLVLGAGIVRRILLLQRDTTSLDGKDHDKYVSDTAGYWSPIVNFEPSVTYRLTKGVGITAGLQLFFDTPATFLSGNPDNQNPRSSKESFHQLGNSGPPLFVPRGLTTNAFDLASNLQVFIGPFVGMTFGP